ncbi:glutamate racemase [Neisseriaceae bacterium ESL0693]|nr:glutamate racemase [Neisseriaceae bacterium ESL0693]
MMARQQKPIGVFDSGVGGLTVVRALMERLPNENIVYFGDTARVPYGMKSRDTIETYTEEIVSFLLGQDVKALVIACNTIAAVAKQKVLQMAPSMPVLDVIKAGSEAALQTSHNRHIGVIATSTTVNSNAYAREIHSRAPEARVLSQACPLLVPLVEEGWLDHEVTHLTIREYLKPILAEDIDTLVLGCTHYPLLKALIKQEAPDLSLVDSSVTTAEATAIALTQHHLVNPDHSGADYRFYVSDIPLRFRTIGEHFLGRSLGHLERVALG